MAFSCLTLCLVISSVATGQEASPIALVSRDQDPERVPCEHVPNLIRLTSQVYSGGLPEGEAAFRELANLGIKTIVSVDGMKPDVETARRFGLRYVHLPHGYDGISVSRCREIAKAIRDLPGPILVHCHHGKHRSPTSATVACVLLGSLDAQCAESVLKFAGTSPHYLGLYQIAKDARPLSKEELDGVEVEFQEVAEVPALTEAMVAMEHRWEHLQTIEKAQWQTPPTHPDLVPAHEALLLRELYAEMSRSHEAAPASDTFKTWLKKGESLVRALEHDLELLAKSKEPAAIQANLAKTSQAIQANCQGCHRQFRDVPQR